LGINLAKWKRWSREFLPPDPLGGMQSGYARQYNLGEAFITALGGHLVGHLKYSVPEARQIIQDLKNWLRAHNFLAMGTNGKSIGDDPDQPIDSYRVYILKDRRSTGADLRFGYVLRGYLAGNDITGRYLRFKEESLALQGEQFVQWCLNCTETPEVLVTSPWARLLNLSRLYQHFFRCLTDESHDSPERQGP
jgi:hypothetical protein